MENYLADDSTLELQIDQSCMESLENGSWWARFISIISIVCMVALLGILFYLMNTDVMSQLEYRLGFSAVTAVIWFVVAVVFIIAGIVLALLMNFANKTSQGVKEMNQGSLERGIGSLKVYLIFSGVLAILGALFSVMSLFK